MSANRSYISNQFSDQDAWDSYANLLTRVLSQVVSDDTLHRKFCRVTDIRHKSIEVQTTALRGFAKKYGLL